MTTKNIVLTGADRFNYGGYMFLKNEEVSVPLAVAEYLLAQSQDFTGYAYFEEGQSKTHAAPPSKAKDDEPFKKPLKPMPKPKAKKVPPNMEMAQKGPSMDGAQSAAAEIEWDGEAEADADEEDAGKEGEVSV